MLSRCPVKRVQLCKASIRQRFAAIHEPFLLQSPLLLYFQSRHFADAFRSYQIDKLLLSRFGAEFVVTFW